MPHWNPNWQDVRWDHGVSDAAIAALERAASEIERLAGERARAVLMMLDEWRGEYRESFNERLRRADGEDVALADELRRAAQRVSRLSEQARIEQKRRERERDEWDRECERERNHNNKSAA
jgi:hypothetical protein